ncbi:MAG: L,D-transpeptidase family protein [Bacteriovoracales bacterium]|nr:L,D-transpeptidase family protein [Bacteriovoracales bacterium]
MTVDSMALGPESSFLPSTILKIDPLLSHHIIVVEKYGHRLFLYENKGSRPSLIKSYSVATGKFSGNKNIQGDKKTPEGPYIITDFRPSSKLIDLYGKEGEIYGAGAFVLNYPNPFDLAAQKTGSGIWLHATNDNRRISAGTDSRGCVVTTDEDLIDIARFVELGKTPFIITENHHFLPEKEWIKRRKKLENLLNRWLKAWKDEDFSTYISFYDPRSKNIQNVRGRRTYAQFRNYKRAVFASPGKPLIKISNISILRERDHLMIRFIQNYRSKNISDTGKKTLYLKQNSSYQWKIIHETWASFRPSHGRVTFTPSQRFFLQQEQVKKQAKN